MDKRDLDGKAALVTGASKGIGRAIALRLAEMGAKVAVNYNTSDDAAHDVVKTIESNGGEAFAVHADVSDLEQVSAMVDRATETWGSIDILVNNAGIIGPTALVQDIQRHEWEAVMDVNVTGVYLCCKAVLPHLLAQRSGRIIKTDWRPDIFLLEV